MTAVITPGYAAPLFALDEVIRADEQGIVMRKKVSPDEPFFAGHFPGRPVFPGVFIFEAVHQAAKYYASNHHGREAELVEIRSLRFIAPVQPGDMLECDCHCTLSEEGQQLCVATVCRCGSRKVAEVKLFYRLRDADASQPLAD
jgi:3-hydroxymyristoyl/3-hydroxydecanoyl-(acyl carrier protein) dehydratase